VPRTSPDDARELLLNAGIEEFREFVQARAADDVLAGLSLERIATRAGYRSVGMIYNLWSNNEGSARTAYFADLLEQIALSYTSVGVELEAPIVTDPVTTVRSMAMTTIMYWSGEGAERHLTGRLLTASLHIPAIREILRDTARKTIDEATELMENCLEFFQFRLKKPLRPIDLAIALRATLLGYLDLTEIHSSELEGFPDQTFVWRGSSGWNAYAVASVGIVLEMIEPIPD
jgi:hypothetical protein